MNPTATSYVIGCMTLGSPAAVQSDEGEYKGCLAAVDGITHICDVEEKYENLIENYIEWESAIGRYALRQMVSFEFEFNDIQTARSLPPESWRTFWHPPDFTSTRYRSTSRVSCLAIMECWRK